jgi:hypothetical protein
MGPSTTSAVGGLRVLVTTLVNGPDHPGVFFSNKVCFLSQLIYCVSRNGSTIEYYYSQHLHDEHSVHTNSDNEYSFQPYIMGTSHSNLNKFIITLFILHMLL